MSVCTTGLTDYPQLNSWFTRLLDKSSEAIKEAFNGKDFNGFLVNKYVKHILYCVLICLYCLGIL